MKKCPECEFSSINNEDLVDHLEYSHFLSYRDYVENLYLLGEEDNPVCFKCNEIRRPLTWVDKDFYYLPCWSCITRKSYKSEAKDDILKNIKSFYKRIMGDRFFQLFVIDDIYYKSTFPHTYSVFSKVLKSLDLPKDRDDMWFLDWYPGFPKTICMENLPGLKVVNLTEYFSNLVMTDTNITVRNFEIRFPERVPYETKHHFRYNILNKTSSRRTKRLRITTTKSTDCVKFYNTSDNNWKSIFKVYRNGEEISGNDISEKDLIILKMSIFRNKAAVKLIFEIIHEILKGVKTFRDGIFLKNTITIDPDKELDFNLTWIPENINNNEFINISIL